LPLPHIRASNTAVRLPGASIMLYRRSPDGVVTGDSVRSSAVFPVTAALVVLASSSGCPEPGATSLTPSTARPSPV
jgi:hypothetical protein